MLSGLLQWSFAAESSFSTIELFQATYDIDEVRECSSLSSHFICCSRTLKVRVGCKQLIGTASASDSPSHA